PQGGDGRADRLNARRRAGNLRPSRRDLLATRLVRAARTRSSSGPEKSCHTGGEYWGTGEAMQPGSPRWIGSDHPATRPRRCLRRRLGVTPGVRQMIFRLSAKDRRKGESRRAEDRRRLRLRPTLLVLEERKLLSTWTVNSTGDAGSGIGLAGDLRYCITG